MKVDVGVVKSYVTAEIIYLLVKVIFVSTDYVLASWHARVHISRDSLTSYIGRTNRVGRIPFIQCQLHGITE
jgi:hypothetical protein